jgi:hypothetical protein
MKSKLKADEMWLVTKLESNQKQPSSGHGLLARGQCNKQTIFRMTNDCPLITATASRSPAGSAFRQAHTVCARLTD